MPLPSEHSYPHRPEFQYHIANTVNGASASIFTRVKTCYHATQPSRTGAQYVDNMGAVLVVSRSEAALALRTYRHKRSVTIRRMNGLGHDMPLSIAFCNTYCPAVTTRHQKDNNA